CGSRPQVAIRRLVRLGLAYGRNLDPPVRGLPADHRAADPGGRRAGRPIRAIARLSQPALAEACLPGRYFDVPGTDGSQDRSQVASRSWYSADGLAGTEPAGRDRL